MKLFWIIACLTIAGCQSVYYEAEKGYVSSRLTIGRWGQEPLEVLVGSVHLTGEDKLVGPLNYSVGAGPVIVTPTDGNAPSLGLDTAAKVILSPYPIQPYFEVGVGFLNATERWDGQGTNWGFIVQGGLGVRYSFSDTTKLGIAYKQWHESNGSSIFGSPGPNPGFEGGSLWITYGFEF